MDKLLQDALQAYNELGGEDYLEKNPELLERILLYKMTKQQEAPELEVVIEIPWLSRDRLAYRTEGNVEDAKLIEQSASRDAPSAALSPRLDLNPWKPAPPEQGLAHILRDSSKKP